MGGLGDIVSLGSPDFQAFIAIYLRYDPAKKPGIYRKVYRDTCKYPKGKFSEGGRGPDRALSLTASPWISSHVSRCQVEKNLLLPYKAGVKKSRRMGPKNWPGGRSEASQHAAAQLLSCGATWSHTFSPGAFFHATGALLMPRTFERYLDRSQIPTTEQVWQCVRSEQTG